MQAHMNNFFGAITQTMQIRLEQHEALVGICRVSLRWQGAEDRGRRRMARKCNSLGHLSCLANMAIIFAIIIQYRFKAL